MSDTAPPGWYHAEGDPDGTVRYWNGTTWTEGPVPAALPETANPPATDEPAGAAREEQVAAGTGPEPEPLPPPLPSANGWYRAFSTTGRINRLTAILLLVFPGPILGVAFVGLMLALVSPSVGSDERQDEHALPAVLAFAVIMVAFAVMTAVTWLNVATAGKRLHDIGMSAWLVLIVFIPMGSLALAVLCFFVPGKPEANNHGLPPPPGFRV